MSLLTMRFAFTLVLGMVHFLDSQASAFVVPYYDVVVSTDAIATTRRQRRNNNNNDPLLCLQAHIFTDLVNQYQSLSATFPLPTQSATFGTFAGVGDALAQQQEAFQQDHDDEDENQEQPTGTFYAAEVMDKMKEASSTPPPSSSPSFDPRRTTRFVLKGLGAGLIWSQWYPLVEGWSDITTAWVLSDTLVGVPDVGTAHTIGKTVSSILMEQFLACPVIYSLWDVPVPALLAGTPVSKIPSLIKEKVPDLLIENAKVWTMANVIVYNLPVQWRLLAVAVAEVFWASIVSSSVDTTSSSSLASKESSLAKEKARKESILIPFDKEHF